MLYLYAGAICAVIAVNAVGIGALIAVTIRRDLA
jgi:hypothetical protein